MEDQSQLFTRIPDELKQLVDADSRTNKDVVTAALWREFGGRKKSALEAKKEHKQKQMNAIEAEIESEREDLQRIQKEIEAMDSQISKMENETVHYESFLDSLLDDLEDGELKHLPPNVITSREDFENLEKPAEEVHDDVKERAAAQDRDLMTSDFLSYQDAERLGHGEAEPIADALDDTGGGDGE